MVEWVIFNCAILFFLAIDLFFHRKNKPIPMKEALLWSGGWIFLALVFAVLLYFTKGRESALIFTTGYLVEKTLSIDNLFVFLLIFKYFKTPPHLTHKALFWGVIGAIIMRGLFIIVGISLVQSFHFILYIFAIFLIYSGIKFALQKEKEIDLEKNIIFRFFASLFPVTPTYEKDRFFIKKGGKVMATPLFLILIALETSDLIFALDSIPIIMGITLDPFLAYTSNILAILGLRSLYFALSHLLDLFVYLHYALALLLIFIGIKMLFSSFFTIPLFLTLSIVITILLTAIILSLLFPKKT